MSATPEDAQQTEHEPLTRVPRHVAIIMDGNGRWARSRGLPRTAGHRAGVQNLRDILRATAEFGVSILTIFAFSTENWSRPATEVRALMMLLERSIQNELEDLHRNGVRIRHIGRTEQLDARLLVGIRHAEELTQHNQQLHLNVALNYGGRADIVHAARQIVSDGIPAEEVSEQTIADRLLTAGIPDPDLIIRTAGEMRLSNFLLWQAAYSEIYSTPIFWPDFGRDELYIALLDYQRRERRFGGVPPSSES